MDEYLWKRIFQYVPVMDMLNVRATCNKFLVYSLYDTETYDHDVNHTFIHKMPSNIYKDILFRDMFIYQGKNKLLINSHDGNIYYFNIMQEHSTKDALYWQYNRSHWGSLDIDDSNIIRSVIVFLNADIKRKVSDEVYEYYNEKHYGGSLVLSDIPKHIDDGVNWWFFGYEFEGKPLDKVIVQYENKYGLTHNCFFKY